LFVGSPLSWRCSMTQAQLDREVAQLTGESVGYIRSMGFSEVDMPYPPQPKQYARQAAIRIQKAKKIDPADQMARRAA
jgi:hypothetical protein